MCSCAISWFSGLRGRPGERRPASSRSQNTSARSAWRADCNPCGRVMYFGHTRTMSGRPSCRHRPRGIRRACCHVRSHSPPRPPTPASPASRSPRSSRPSAAQSFEPVGAYERLLGRAHGEVNPSDLKNAIIQDIDARAAQCARHGRVRDRCRDPAAGRPPEGQRHPVLQRGQSRQQARHRVRTTPTCRSASPILPTTTR